MKKDYRIKNKEVEKIIEDAEASDGYMLLITRLNGAQLTHIITTKTFGKEDMLASISELSMQVKKAVKQLK
jgi:hypothetical protein